MDPDYGNMTDAELVERILQRDDVEFAFGELVRRHYDYAVNVAYQMVRHRWPQRQDAACDIAQEAFVRVYTKLETYDSGISPFPNWLRTIVVRQAIDWFRRNKNRPQLLGDQDTAVVQTRQPSPEETLIDREYLEELCQQAHLAWERLKRHEQVLLEGHHVLGQTNAQLASTLTELTGNPTAESAVPCRLTRAKNNFLKYLGNGHLNTSEFEALLRGFLGGSISENDDPDVEERRGDDDQ